ncbi:MAG: energy transducer TonB [Treponema sp.]|jgi:protein TonB|nr:energy transducer TonB [Treponema sp.]
MTVENRLRLVLFAVVAAIHGILIFFISFNAGSMIASSAISESARVMKLTDIAEERPIVKEIKTVPIPPENMLLQNIVESIAENMIETEEAPDQIVAAPGTFIPQSAEDYLPMHRVSVAPKFDERILTSNLIYPSIALRSGIEGRVILELFIDRTGTVQRITVLQETPPDRGFGEAAIKAFTGLRCSPAFSNGEAVSVRYRYPVSFRIK